MQKVRIPLAVTANAALILVPGAAWAQNPSYPGRYFHGPGMMGWGGDGSGMIFGPLIMILVLAAVIAVTVLLVRWIGGPWPGGSSHQAPTSTPLDILKERYARGEIDKEEYEERRRVLGE